MRSKSKEACTKGIFLEADTEKSKEEKKIKHKIHAKIDACTKGILSLRWKKKKRGRKKLKHMIHAK